jgi:thymidine phosphorylase
MRAVIILKKRRWRSEPGEIQFFVPALPQGPAGHQASALLYRAAARYERPETAWLTDDGAPGVRVDLSAIPGVKVDKTAPVASATRLLILAPLAAACGVPVPMMRAAPRPQAAPDKLEAIPGFRVNLR